MLPLLVVGPPVVVIKGQIVCNIVPCYSGEPTPKASGASSPSTALAAVWHGVVAQPLGLMIESLPVLM
jgi:hypothetical protein